MLIQVFKFLLVTLLSVLILLESFYSLVLKEDETEPPHKKRRKSLTGSTVKSVSY